MSAPDWQPDGAESAADVEQAAAASQGANEDRAFGAFDCGYCGKTATGLASIGDRRYCHDDNDDEPTCYEKAQWEMSGIRPDLTLLQNEAMHEVYGA